MAHDGLLLEPDGRLGVIWGADERKLARIAVCEGAEAWWVEDAGVRFRPPRNVSGAVGAICVDGKMLFVAPDRGDGCRLSSTTGEDTRIDVACRFAGMVGQVPVISDAHGTLWRMEGGQPRAIRTSISFQGPVSGDGVWACTPTPCAVACARLDTGASALLTSGRCVVAEWKTDANGLPVWDVR